MCGIAGAVDLVGRPVDPTLARRMGDALTHRGPDDEGQWAEGPVALANRRLAVIDLTEGGHQPMISPDGRTVLVYNGELYNAPELRSDLERRGHAFRSRSDTEVALRSYEEWGPAAVERLDGMFAFAVWDGERRRLVLARDRFGVKPLYYAVDDGRFLFASEVKALLEAGLRPDVSPEALVEYFTFQNVVSDLTLFNGVRILPPGHLLLLDDGKPRLERYWQLELEPDDGPSVHEWTGRIREAFESTVRRQLVSDVPLGSFLSGGMDSASIAAVAGRSVPRLMTFTGGFDLSEATGIELVFDERDDAEQIARTFRTEHYEMVMHAGDMAWVLPELVWHLEDLRSGMSWQNHYIARLAAKFVKVALAGTGGDELFAGYPWRYDLVATASTDEFERRYYDYWSRLVNDDEKASFFTPAYGAAVSTHPPYEVFRSKVARTAGQDPVARALTYEAETFLHGLLVVEDRISMAHSLEVRVPFLGDEVVEIARRIPTSLTHTGKDGKPLLRDAMRGLLPPAILEKPKQGFSPPDQSWYRGPSIDYVRGLLLEPRTLERGYFEPAAVKRVVEEHAEGRRNHRLLIWSLLCFEWWNRLFVDGEPTTGHERWHTGDASRLVG
jgi:asparagine synthase (glutamine-hydrolysing)